MKFRKEASIGFIIIVALALFYWGINFLKGRNIFTTSTQYYAVYNNIGGLQKSSAVTASGYKVGTVTDIEFHRGDINKIVVEISIDRKFQIPSNSIIEIYSTDFMGSKAVNLILGDAETFARQNDTLKSKFEGDINTLVSKKFLPLKDKAENLIVSTDSVMHVIHNIFNTETQHNLQQSIASLKEIITGQKQKINQILTNLNSISENLEKSNKSFTNVVDNLSTITDSIKAADVKKVMDQTRISLEQANAVLLKINKGEGTVGKMINNDSVYLSLNKTIKDLDTLLVDLQNNPKKYVHFSVFGKKDSKTK